MRVKPEVVATQVQRLGVLGWTVEAAYLVFAIGFFGVLGQGPVMALLLGAGAETLRFCAFVGVSRRRIFVSSEAIRMGGTMIPMGDVRGAEELTRAELRRRTHQPGPGFSIRTHIALPEGVAVRTVTPEGIEVEWLIGARDAAALVAAITSCIPTRARPELGVAPKPLPVRARQGLRASWMVPALLIAGTGDAISISNGQPPVTVAAVLAIGGWTGLRKVVIDEWGIRVGTFTISWPEVESARVVSFAECSGIEVRRTRNPPWGARWALIVVRRGEGLSRERSASLGIPHPVELPERCQP
ncbi:MAG: DUF3093 family protein [Actinobacteria bacterium]|nr:DUF3093 family protein [Actinomycetota bacterium]